MWCHPAGIHRRFIRMYDLPWAQVADHPTGCSSSSPRSSSPSPLRSGSCARPAPARSSGAPRACSPRRRSWRCWLRPASWCCSRVDRPSLLVTAGTVLVPCSLISLVGLTLPLLVPAVMLLVTGAPPPTPVATARALCGRHHAGGLALVVAAGLALIAHDDPRTYATPTSSGGTSDVVTVAESLLCLGLLEPGRHGRLVHGQSAGACRPAGVARLDLAPSSSRPRCCERRA